MPHLVLAGHISILKHTLTPPHVSTGKPTPVIRWFKEGHEITGSADFEMTVRDGRITMSIPEVFEEDAGTYECQARNMAGTITNKAMLVVEGRGKTHFKLSSEFPQRLEKLGKSGISVSRLESDFFIFYTVIENYSAASKPRF